MGTFYSTHDAARLLGVDAHTVARWVDKGLLQADVTAGGHRRISPDAVRTFLERKKARTSGGLRLLVVDDEPAALEAIRRNLHAVDSTVDVTLARTGAEGLVSLLLERPDAALVDLTMPGLGGVELIASVARKEQLKGTALVGMTAHLTESLLRGALEAGASTCLEKPLDGAHILQLVKACGAGGLSE